MKIGINLLAWNGTITEDHVFALELLKDMGYDGVEFPMFSFDYAMARKLKKHLDRLKMDSTVCTITLPDANPVSEDKKIRQAGLNHIKKAIKTCDILGSKTLIGPLGAPCGTLVGRPRTEDEWNWGVETMQKAAADAQKVGVDIAFEPINRFETYFINTVGDAYEFAKQVNEKNFGILYDTFHANIEEKSMGKSLKDVIDKVFHVHISENDRGIPGSGHIRFGEIFKTLKANKYNRWLTIEAFGDAVPEVAAATCIWREMFTNQEELCRKGLDFIQKQWKKA
ncbi:TIM barrel protein [bacterium]|nr:TIM barrel protein [bacterium]